MSARGQVNEIHVTGPHITLADLHWLVEQCASMKPTSRVELRGAVEHDQRDTTPERITVHGEPESFRVADRLR